MISFVIFLVVMSGGETYVNNDDVRGKMYHCYTVEGMMQVLGTMRVMVVKWVECEGGEEQLGTWRRGEYEEAGTAAEKEEDSRRER